MTFAHSLHVTSLQGFEVLLGVPGLTCIRLYSRVAETCLVVQQVGFSPHFSSLKGMRFTVKLIGHVWQGILDSNQAFFSINLKIKDAMLTHNLIRIASIYSLNALPNALIVSYVRWAPQGALNSTEY